MIYIREELNNGFYKENTTVFEPIIPQRHCTRKLQYKLLFFLIEINKHVIFLYFSVV